MIIFCLFFFLLCLIFPEIAGNGVLNGIKLVCIQVVPALYPFILLTTILKYLSKRRPVSKFFLFFLAFLSGYPIGAKMIAEQFVEKDFYKKIPLHSLLVICNNPSPAYMISFAGLYCFSDPWTGFFMYLVILIGNLIVGFMGIFEAKFSKDPMTPVLKAQDCSERQGDLERILQDTFSTILLISLCILSISILAAFIQKLPMSDVLQAIVTGSLEMTTGIEMIKSLRMAARTKILLITPLVSFGGASIFIQTAGVLAGTNLSIKKYMKEKVMASVITFSFMYIILFVFNIKGLN